MPRSEESYDSFDAFYASTRDQLLHESYALCGDISAARSAVRDAYVTAWPHWRKVGALEDPEAWVRPIAHGIARRRHATRPWHRDKSIDPQIAATLDALASLSRRHRQILVLAGLSTLSVPEISQAAGLPRADGERELQVAIDEFVAARRVPESDITSLLMALRGPITDHQWPRSPAIRRAGTTRRRLHTAAGIGLACIVLITAGGFVASGGSGSSTLSGERATSTPSTPVDPDLVLSEEALATVEQVSTFGPTLTWIEGATSDNLSGDGLVLPCQKERFADPDGVDALTRSWKGKGEVVRRTRTGKGANARVEKSRTSVQLMEATELVELSASVEDAAASYQRARMWFADCIEPRIQLLSTRQVRGVGDSATQFRMRSWGKHPSIIHASVTHTGQRLITSVVRPRGKPLKDAAVTAAMASTVDVMCGSPGAGACVTRAKGGEIAPLPIASAPQMLATVDLPPVSEAVGPWVGTEPEAARTNFAATRCDRTSFRQKGIKKPRTRTFLFPEKKGADQFGLTQTSGRMNPKFARKFVNTVRDRIRACGRANLGTSVTMLRNRVSAGQEITVWVLSIEVSDARAVPFMMGIARDGTQVTQVGFTPDGKMTMSRPDFVAAVERALARLGS